MSLPTPLNVAIEKAIEALLVLDPETRSRLAQLRQSPEYTALKFAGHEGSEFFFLPSREFAALTDLPLRL